MRERNSPTPLERSSSHASFGERHYSVKEVAEMWGLSADSIRRLFDDEPGVLVIGDRNHQRKRRYHTLRIPQSVIERVHRRMCSR